jgi:hypothetical protein
MYVANTPDNQQRMTYYMPYLNVGIPTLVGDGVLLGASGNPPEYEEMVPLIDALLTAEPGFSISVEAPLSPSAVNATVTLLADRRVDLAGCGLRVALVENPLVFETPPGSEGETEFHWVMRDLVTLEAALPQLVSGQPLVREVSLTRNPAWIADNLHVIAFVQDIGTKAIRQAGFSTASEGAGISLRIDRNSRAVPPEPTGGTPR